MKDMEKELHEHHDDDDECECGCGHHHHHDDEEHEHEHHHHHDEDDECECGCGHHHHHDDEEHEHEHHHHHDEDDECECGCGHHHHHDDEEHEHEHHHHHDEDDECECGCGHHHHHDEEEHEHHHEHHHEHGVTPAGAGKKTYIVENLCCANCAAKMERKIQALPGVEEATLTYMTKKLVVISDHQEDLLPKIQKICSSIESGVQVTAMPDSHHHHEEEEHAHHHHHDEDDECECGCGHHHHHDDEEHEHHHHHHDEDDECECGCGHHHHHHDEDDDDDECGCGCGHHHHHHDEDDDDDECGCGCGHHHHHHDEDDDDDECGCGCGHHHHDHDHHHEVVEHEPYVMPAGVAQKTYILENLGCANCAAKMERKIQALPEVEGANLTYATKKLVVASDHQENLLPKIQEICSSIESEVQVVAMPDNQPVKREKKNPFEENKKEIILVGAGAVLFAAGVIAEKTLPNPMISACIFIIAYLILGLEIVIKALKNMAGGQLFDENFLMAVATIAAFAIGDFAEAVGVMLFYRIGELFEDIAVEKSRGQIMDAVDMRPEVINLVVGSEVKEIPSQDARVKDIIMIRPGDRIPLDAKVVEGESRIDTSPVTGEPVPVRVVPGDELLSGCINEQGVLKAEVTKPLSESMVTKILDSVENAAASKPKIDRFITRFARVYTPVVVIAAVLTAIIPSLVTGDWNHWIYTAITFLVISCPCALVLSVPLAFFSGIGAGSKRGILFKGGAAIEALKDVKAVIMDKTGTITKGNFAVQKVTATRKLTEKQVLTMAADCELGSTHPIAVSIVQEARRQNLTLTRPKEVEEISGKGIRAVFPEGTVLLGNYALMEMYQVDTTGYKKGGYGSEVLLAVDGVLEGFVIVADEIKTDAVASVSKMKSLGIATVMLTGDEKNSAQAVAKETGIDEVYAQLLPQEKLEHLQNVRKNHGAVMFVGDGINDAPVLAGADVGAAMGSGADAAIEAADVVFMNSSVEAIPQSIAIAKKTGNIAIQNVVFALAIKAIVMVLGFLGYANMWLAVFADTGVAMLCVLNSIRAMYVKTK